jgi:hypothetical protein
MSKINDLEGYLLMDHRDSPGVPDEMVKLAGLPEGAGRGLFECPIYTCGHCQKGVPVVVGAFGTREKRYVCSKCRHVLCLDCARAKALTDVCDPFESKIERMLAGHI